ncbi:MAG: LysR family transcriptional regulator [Pseudomonadota bacterium]
MAKRIPSLNWLRVFEAAARTNSFARAAERLAMSPPAVSQQIRALEDHLGRPLFERAAAGVTLTEAGRSLLVVTSDAIGRMEAAAEALSAPSGPPLVIGVSQTLYTGWLAPRLARFLAAQPDVTLEFRSLLGRETPPRDATLWIAFGQPPPGTESIKLFGETLIPVAHARYAELIERVEDVLDHPLIEVTDHRKNWAHVLGRDVLPASAKVIQVDTTLAALSLAGSGCGLALSRPPASDDLVARFDLVPCLPSLAVDGVEHYHIVSNAGARLGAGAVAFRNWIVAEASSAAR